MSKIVTAGLGVPFDSFMYLADHGLLAFRHPSYSRSLSLPSLIITAN